jgi:predicted ATPase/DNA-binding SARP family transcriptional activator
MSAVWRIQLLGGLRAQHQQRTLDRFRTQKTGALLAYLAFYRERTHPREALADLLWPEAAAEAGLHNLRMALSSLRHQLEPPGVPAGLVLHADRYTVQLCSRAVATDVAEFEAAVQAAAQADNRLDKLAKLTEAISLYGGPLLAGCYESWIVPQQLRLEDMYVQAALQLLTELERAGEVSEAIRYASHALTLIPACEAVHLALIRVYMRAGQPTEALQQYRRLEQNLQDEWGEPPSAAARQLADTLRVQLERIPAPPPSRAQPAAPIVPRLTASLPSGTVTFLLTDIEGSTALFERLGEVFARTLRQHHALLRQTIARHGGQEVKEVGDGFVVAFARADAALACAIAAQRALSRQEERNATDSSYPPAQRSGQSLPSASLHVRMALHTGDVTADAADYHTPVLNRAARMLTAAHGGQVLCSEATATLLRRDLPPDLRLVDLGCYRLRDVSGAERLYQVSYPDMPVPSFPPLRAPTAYATNLPAQLTRFFGREAEMMQLQQRLLTAGARLLTLSGPGGSGKTRLAIEVASRLLEPFSGAVWFVPLADVSDAGRIVSAVQEALQLPPLSEKEPLEQVTEALSKQSCLLVLDNFEQVVEEGAAVVQTLLARIPTLTCLLTSRQRLNLAGERELTLMPLPIPEVLDTPEQLLEMASVQLFVDRAQAARADFQLTRSNAQAVAELCRHLEGIPLALELAAARAQVMSPAQMLGQLANRLDFFVNRQRNTAARHKTLRATIEWSFRLLSAELQPFFAGLSVFRGGWTAEAAEVVCEEAMALDYLVQLRECSLIFAQEEADTIRFQMLETLREYASEQMSPEQRRQVQRRHTHCFLTLAEFAAPQLQGAEQASWLERLETEHGNLRAALERCLRDEEKGKRSKQQSEEDSPSPEALGLRLAGALHWFWQVHGYWKEGRTYLTQALGREGAAAKTKERAEALNGAGNLAYNQGDFAGACRFHEESLAIRRELGDKRGIAKALNGLGNVAYDQGDYETARTLHAESLGLLRELGDRQGIAISLINLGSVIHYQGDYRAATTLYAQGLSIKRELGDKRGIAISLNNLGNVTHDQGDFAGARRFHEESLAIRRELGDKRGIANSLNNLGNVAYDQGDYETARTLHEESLGIKRELGARQGIAISLMNLGNVIQDQGDRAAARALYEESLAIHREMGDRLGVANSLNNLGNVAYDQGDYGTARALQEESLAIFRELGDRQGIASTLEGFAYLAMVEGQRERAVRLWGGAKALREAIGSPLPPNKREESERRLAAVRAALGEEAFAAAWAKGRSMTLEQAIVSDRE